MRLRSIRDKDDAPVWRLSCRCCEGFDFREFLREKAETREANEEIEMLVEMDI